MAIRTRWPNGLRPGTIRFTVTTPISKDRNLLMHPVTVELVLYSSLVSVLLASVVGVFWAWGWALRQLWTGRGLLDNVRLSALREAPWGAPTILAVVFLYVLVNYSVFRGYAAATARHLPRPPQADQQKNEPDKPDKDARDKAIEKNPPIAEVVPPARPGEKPEQKERAMPVAEPATQTEAEVLAQLAVINTLLLILVPALVRLTSGAAPADFGIDFRRLKEPMAVGAVAALLMTPAVLAVQSLAIRIWPPHKHPVEDMILEEFTPAVALLAVLSTMILAPMIEELLFRGILQRWLTTMLSGRESPSFSLDELQPVEQVADAWVEDAPYRPSASEFQPPKPAPVSRSPGFSTTAILMTSYCFAAMHLPQWPSPIGIFLLSLALGAVYQKTGSLIASITMHGVFNGFSTVGLLLVALGHHLHPPRGGAAHAFIAHLLAALGLAAGFPG